MGVNKLKLFHYFSFTIFLIISFSTVFSQKITRRQHDSALAQIKNDTIIPFLINKVRAYTVTIDRNSSFLKRKINLENVSKELPGIETDLKSFKERLNKGTSRWNLRGLNSIIILLRETSERLAAYQENLNNYSRQLTQNNNDVKVIINDPLLDIILPDSMLETQMEDVHNEVFELDTLQQRALSQVNLMRNRTSIALLQCNDILFDLSYQVTELKRAMWQQEEPYLLTASPAAYPKPFLAVTLEGLERSFKIISIYPKHKGLTLSLCLLFFLFILAWGFSNMQRIKRMDNAPDILAQVIFFKRSVLVASLFGLLVYSPFFLANPPMSYLHATELLRLLALSFLLAPLLAKHLKVYGILLIILWVYFAVDDVLLVSAFGQRWALFITSTVLAAVCIQLINYKGKFFSRIEESTASKALLIFTLAQAILSLGFNLAGLTSLAKILGVSAIQCLVLGVSLKIFSAIVLEVVYIQSEAYGESRFSEFLNFKALQSKLKRGLWIISVILWAVSLLRDYTLYDWFTNFIIAFFTDPRSIGSMVFTFQSVAIFFAVIFLSTIISKCINFFLGSKETENSAKRSSIGSMRLLIKLAIWALGFVIAIAASGIPLDRLSIMIGAFSVGIGFGLQNIVNNLVSGVIIAFEQPIKIGDQIEVGNKAGTVKEIGVRSSTIKSGDGANIIIPNGDLLSQHLINWTMQNRNKRVEFIIGIAYTANIIAAKSVIQDTLEKNNNILHNIEPVIMVQAFGEKAVEVRIIFWVPDLTTSGTLRSSVMIEIYEALQAAGISLPNSQT